MLDRYIDPDPENPFDLYIEAVVEDRFEASQAQCYYDEEKFREFLEEKYDSEFEKITNNGENEEKWDEFINEKMESEDFRSNEFFDHFMNDYEEWLRKWS